MIKALPGLTEDETDGLRMLFAFGIPGGRSRVQKRIGKHLDGDDKALEGAPAIKAHVDKAVTLIKGKS